MSDNTIRQAIGSIEFHLTGEPLGNVERPIAVFVVGSQCDVDWIRDLVRHLNAESLVTDVSTLDSCDLHWGFHKERLDCSLVLVEKIDSLLPRKIKLVGGQSIRIRNTLTSRMPEGGNLFQEKRRRPRYLYNPLDKPIGGQYVAPAVWQAKGPSPADLRWQMYVAPAVWQAKGPSPADLRTFFDMQIEQKGHPLASPPPEKPEVTPPSPAISLPAPIDRVVDVELRRIRNVRYAAAGPAAIGAGTLCALAMLDAAIPFAWLGFMAGGAAMLAMSMFALSRTSVRLAGVTTDD